MRIAVRHQLSFDRGPGAAHAIQQILLSPQSGPTQTVVDWTIDVEGIDNAARFVDGFGNSMLMVNQEKAAGAVLVTVSGTVDTVDRHGVVGRVAGEPVPALFRRMTPQTKSAATIHGKFRGASRKPEDRIGLLHAIMARVGEVYVLEGLAEDAGTQGQSQSQGGQSQSQSQSSGATRADAATIAHAFIGAARTLDIPARFVTGYLAGDGDHKASFHAWAEAYDEGLGWIAFDPSLNICPTTRHVRVATGLDALSTQAVRAIPEHGAGRELSVSVEGHVAQ